MSNNKKNKKSKYIGSLNISRLSIVIIMLLVVVIGGTFAWFTYRSRETALVLSIGDINQSKVIIKPYQIKKNMVPTNTYFSDDNNDENDVFSQITAINNNSESYSMILFYRINELDEVLVNNGLKYTIVGSDSIDGEYTEVKSGDFVYAIGNNEFEILSTDVDGNTTKYYRVYLWLDSSVGEQSLVQNLQLDLELNGMIEIAANKPVLDEGMIPVVISNDGIVTTVSEDDVSWYDYKKQKWANIVLVDSDSRSTYLNTKNVEVSQEDILAYYVWIPRYRYKVWTTDASATTSPQTINILFESQNDPMITASKVGDYMTHPAFWWDKNSDGEVTDNEMLPGIWVGKFETTGDATTPTVKPNLQSLRGQNVSTQFQTSLKFAGGTMDTSTGNVSFNGNNTYGLTSQTDSHMMKNSEWGAVAYLSHSNYGINEEIYINNSSEYYTGRSSGAVGNDDTEVLEFGTYTWIGQPINSDGTFGTITDTTLGTNASTTGNVTGIYDMSGGAYENVMGHYGDTIDEDYDYSGFTLLPIGKYYDLYPSTIFVEDYLINMSLCTLSTCGGHALYEIVSYNENLYDDYAWYHDYSYFVDLSYSWFVRGGGFDFGTYMGIFRSDFDAGAGNVDNGFRSVLVPTFEYDVMFDANGGYLENETISYSYTSVGEHEFVVPYDGEYQLEVWGAQGGVANGYRGGYGGYSVGIVELQRDSSLYINIGGAGRQIALSSGSVSGGYNGGGNGYGHGDKYVGSGGGASHIATASGILSSLSQNKDAILIVAGGGGGTAYETSEYYGIGGSGGGYIGNSSDGGRVGGSGGNQTSGGGGARSGNGGGFGQGGNSSANATGGGGGYYGGGGGYYYKSGGGGSGYIGNNLLTDKAMYCYSCSTSNNESTLTYSTTNVSNEAISKYAKSGSGYARITPILCTYNEKKIVYNGLYGDMPIPTREGYVFVGWNTKADGSGTMVTESSIVNMKTNHTLYAIWKKIDYKESILNGAAPTLETGMIPIILSDTGVATVADTSQEWYSYANKEWANAVLVKKDATNGIDGSKSREFYLNNPGTEILDSDILAYYVWIPRYKYAFPVLDGYPETISVIFESSDTKKSKGTATGTSYYTHPAFTFGSQELNGIWVGKFETSGDATTPKIIPNVSSLRGQTVSEQFQTALKFAGGTMNTSTGVVSFSGNTTYGLTNVTDSHMIKNNEWGAVAYLSHSDYGINQEIYINNSKGFYTGRSGGDVAYEGMTSSTYGKYTWIGQNVSSNGTIGAMISDITLATNASTTGNITGVYDISGGAYESVMGHYGITIDQDYDASGFSILPASKYYDSYSTSVFIEDELTNIELCTLATCGGDALFETGSWHDDFAYFVYSEHPWFLRGGFYGDDYAYAGAFSSFNHNGFDDSNFISFRSVIVNGI